MVAIPIVTVTVTGLPDTGKTTICEIIAAALRRHEIPVVTIETDASVVLNAVPVDYRCRMLAARHLQVNIIDDNCKINKVLYTLF